MMQLYLVGHIIIHLQLGAGARVDGGTVVVQGDQRESAARWLEGRGATVVLGN